ncbi:hypothetical protein J0H58_29965 [bacterium]|nr:hypothetical protein [bacterium]
MNRPSTPAARALAVLALAGGLGGVAWSVADGGWDGGRAPAPYAWADVAAVHVACAVPLALVLTLLVTSSASPGGSAVVAAACLAAGLVGPAVTPPPVPGAVLRPAVALLTLSGVTLAVAVCSDRLTGGGRVGRLAVPVALGAATLVVPPATFVDARCRHDLARLGEWVGQSRVGEARAVAQGLVVLAPGLGWNGRPVGEVAADLDRVVARLEQRVAVPLRETATTQDRVDRGVALAMLGRTGEALDVLTPVDDPRLAAEVGILRGTVHEARGEWDAGLAAYRVGRTAWEARPPSPARNAGILRAPRRPTVTSCWRSSTRMPSRPGPPASTPGGRRNSPPTGTAPRPTGWSRGWPSTRSGASECPPPQGCRPGAMRTPSIRVTCCGKGLLWAPQAGDCRSTRYLRVPPALTSCRLGGRRFPAGGLIPNLLDV